MKNFYSILFLCLFLYPVNARSSTSSLPEKKDVPCPQFCHLMTDEELVKDKINQNTNLTLLPVLPDNQFLSL